MAWALARSLRERPEPFSSTGALDWGSACFHHAATAFCEASKLARRVAGPLMAWARLVAAAGELAASVAQAPSNMGKFAIEALLKLKKGEKVDAWVDTGTVMVTKDNAAQYK